MAGPQILYVLCLLGGASLYVLLSGRRVLSLYWGVGLGILALVALSLILRTPMPWWSERSPESAASSPLFYLCGLATVVAAAGTVTAERGSRAAVWFLVTLLSVAALLLIHDAQYLAAGIVFVGGGMTTLMLLVAQQAELAGGNDNVESSHETLLACCCGTLLAIGLMGTMHHSVGSASKHDSENWPKIVKRWETRIRPAVGQRLMTARQTRSKAAGRSLFEDHGVAMILLVVLVFVGLVVALMLTRESLRARQGQAQYAAESHVKT